MIESVKSTESSSCQNGIIISEITKAIRFQFEQSILNHLFKLNELNFWMKSNSDKYWIDSLRKMNERGKETGANQRKTQKTSKEIGFFVERMWVPIPKHRFRGARMPHGYVNAFSTWNVYGSLCSCDIVYLCNFEIQFLVLKCLEYKLRGDWNFTYKNKPNEATQ